MVSGASGRMGDERMRQADQVLDDDELLEAVYQAQGKRRPKSHCRGRKQTPAEVVLRLAVLKHMSRAIPATAWTCRWLPRWSWRITPSRTTRATAWMWQLVSSNATIS